MIDPKLAMEVPAHLRDMAAKSVDSAEAAISTFMEAAGKSVQGVPSPMGDVAKQALAISETNLKASFDHARKLMQAKDIAELMRLQTEYVRYQFGVATEQFQKIAGAARDLKDKPESV